MAKKLSKEEKKKELLKLVKKDYELSTNVKAEGTKYDKARATVVVRLFEGLSCPFFAAKSDRRLCC